MTFPELFSVVSDRSSAKNPAGKILFVAALALSAGAATAAQTFSFEEADPFASSTISGHKASFAATTEQARTGTKSVKFVDPAPLPYESWTYSAPFSVTSGTITVWFHDSRGPVVQGNPYLAKWGGSVILEDAAATGDFGAVEICDLPYGGAAYFASEGSIDRGPVNPGDKFDSNSLPPRSVGFHKVEFAVGALETVVKVDGLAADEIRAPGGQGRSLRLRFMADSASVGGSGNWTTSTATTSYGTAAPWVTLDDLSFVAELPAANTHSMGFEVPGGAAEYDTAGVFMGPAANDNPYMAGSVNQWATTTTAALVRSGSQGFVFANPPQPFRSLVFDLGSASAGTTATVWVYDAKGADVGFNATGGSVIVENGANPADFLAAEVWNAPYPSSGDPTPGAPNYYLARGSASGPTTFYSRDLGNRSVGWHKFEIGLYATHSIIAVDGRVSDDGGAIPQGPGLDKSPRLRLMGDSASSGGFANWTNIGELTALYLQTTSPYVYFDDVTLPETLSSVSDWQMYQ